MFVTDRWGLRLASTLLLLLCATYLEGNDDGLNCCPDCGCVEGGKFIEVVQTRCKMVPEVVAIKKTIYECREVPYCEHALSAFGTASCCPKCESCAKKKTVLVKKEIKCGEKTEMKCVTEEVKVIVPIACPHCGHRRLH